VGYPKHRPSCHSLLFRTECRRCRQAVYLYFCTCHSGRLLEENHPPWTPHDCSEHEEQELAERVRQQFERRLSGSRLIKAAQVRKKKRKKSTIAKPLRLGQGLLVISAREAAMPRGQWLSTRPKQGKRGKSK